MRPTMRQLEALLVVAECRSFSAAARQLGVSQPAVTRTISELEASAGAKLFERTAAGVFLTPFGKSLERHASAILSELKHADLELAAMRGAAFGRVAVGTTPAGAAWLIPSAIEMFALSKPEVRVFITETRLALMFGALRAGDLDLVIAPLTNDESAIEFAAEEIYRDQFCAVVNSRHPAKTSSKISLGALSRYPWIVPPADTRPGTWVQAMFKRHNLPLPRSLIETQAINIVRELLLRDERPWIAVLPRDFFADDQRKKQLSIIKLPLGDSLRAIGVLRRARASRAPLADAFVACLHEAAATGQRDILPGRRLKQRRRVHSSN